MKRYISLIKVIVLIVILGLSINILVKQIIRENTGTIVLNVSTVSVENAKDPVELREEVSNAIKSAFED